MRHHTELHKAYTEDPEWLNGKMFRATTRTCYPDRLRATPDIELHNQF